MGQVRELTDNIRNTQEQLARLARGDARGEMRARLAAMAREGRFEQGGHRKYQPSSNVSVIFGLFMLWWGWIGFNCGSTLMLQDYGAPMARVAVTTTLAAATCGATGLLIKKFLPKALKAIKLKATLT